ncbi:branched-chain amino acid transport system II carrier protein [Spongiivirga citrea]|uniref:Branched-chain amino acid transport system II carrier protein n=1 Tax=Spongiivirga citrea TaxID=1481457 RepID=A0A6M0CHP0_9FLAO|nr:branched-chain amino acid transport system II carrier protein [Spongiivirga citrea]NER17032.1 branched-chain amino acid transport system II carrier protein [Spongiivirga citrea]
MSKQQVHIWVTAFALFSLFFGAGNLILPPFLGFNAGSGWAWVTIGFALSAVIIPIIAIIGHARLQGTMMDFANKISPLFALIYCILVYLISIALPAPRTASVAYEIAIQPYFDFGSLWFSTIYFVLVLVFVLNRSKILDVVGKYLTPAIILILLAIIGIGVFADYPDMRPSIFDNTFTSGIIEGYQTFDAIGGVVVGGVIVISLGFKTESFSAKKEIIAKAGIIAGLGLLLIYGGLILLGALNSDAVDAENRTALVTLLSKNTLGNIGTVFLGVLVSLACFTTAVGIVTGTADFIKGLFGQSDFAYKVTAVIGSILGVAVGQFDVHYIIDIAVPALMFIYPITIVLILLNVLNKKWATPMVFRAVVITTIVFSLPDFLSTIGFGSEMASIKTKIPLGDVSMGWLLPSLAVFLVINLINNSIRNKNI